MTSYSIPKARRETAEQFEARMATWHSAMRAVHNIQEHICRDHPLALSVAVAQMPEFDPELVDEAVSFASHFMHDPFVGIA